MFEGRDAAERVPAQMVLGWAAWGKDIDFAGDDALGWQEVVYDDDGTTILARYDLYDETATRINETIGSFVLRNGMIASRRLSP